MDDGADALAAVISDAIANYLADNGGGMATSFAACIEYLDSDGDRCWATAHHDNQSPSATFGLLRWHTLNVEQQCVGLMYDDGEG